MSLNILFLTYHEVTPQKGGIERMTDVVVNNLLNREGFYCYSAYYYPNKLEHTIFQTNFVWNVEMSINNWNILSHITK